MPKYEIQYKNNSKTFTDILEASSTSNIVDAFKTLYNAELTEIREILYTDRTYPKDDGNYKKTKKILMINEDDFHRTLNIPKVKTTLSDDELLQFALQYLRMNDKKIPNFKLYNV